MIEHVTKNGLMIYGKAKKHIQKKQSLNAANGMNIDNDERDVDQNGQNELDGKLVARVKAGDDNGFNVILQRYRRPVINFIFRMIDNVAEAEELAQGVFVRAYRHMRRPAFRPTGAAFSTWLFQIARNAALDCLRHRKRHPTESIEHLDDRGETTPDTKTTTTATVVAHEIGEQIAAAIARLPEDQRTAIVLSEYQGFSYAQIAAIMRCSKKSVEARLYRARRFLRKRLIHLLN